MFLTRKLMLLVAMIGVLALTASNAHAQVEFVDEDAQTHCSPVSLVNHAVFGGCHVEFQSEEHISLVAYVPTPIVVMNCNWHFGAQIGESGEGYVTSAELTNEPVPPTPSCTRAPCDEPAPSHAMIPWPIHVFESSPGEESVEMEFCLRTIASGEGGAQTQCGVHMPLTNNGGHNYEVGDHAEYFCEVSPGFPVSIQDVHFINETPPEVGTNDMEFHH